VLIEGIPSTKVLTSIRKLGELFSIHFLRQIGQNLANLDDDLNESIGNYFMDFVAQKMKEIFLDRRLYADVKFVFPGIFETIFYYQILQH